MRGDAEGKQFSAPSKIEAERISHEVIISLSEPFGTRPLYEGARTGVVPFARGIVSLVWLPNGNPHPLRRSQIGRDSSP